MAIEIGHYFDKKQELLVKGLKFLLLTQEDATYTNDFMGAVYEDYTYGDYDEFPEFWVSDKSRKELRKALEIDMKNSNMGLDELVSTVSELGISDTEELIPEFVNTFRSICHDFLKKFIEDTLLKNNRVNAYDMMVLAYDRDGTDHIRFDIYELIDVIVGVHTDMVINELYD